MARWLQRFVAILISRWALLVATALILVFMYVPIVLIVVQAFNPNRAASWPPSGLSLRWVEAALQSEGLRQAMGASFTAAIGATALALVLGSLAALAVARFRFFGRETMSFVVLLPIALPGIVTAVALRSTFTGLDVQLGMFTIILGHATFCIVIVYNNVLARERRMVKSPEEASMDLGADALQTFRHITLPQLGTALVAGALLAFALSFDELIVTNFLAGGVKTLPIWILSNFRLANQAPVVNVAAMVAILLSIVPVFIAQRLAGAESATTR
ncbi:MAG TPA: ABC transporter permease [Candidatus Limnocylindrales bacterium]|nr:ABC transporter permease [Candidatus Limnocylindrales bacterium]